MCFACEMAGWWFAEMEEAARRAAAPPDHVPANAEVTGADGAGRDPQNHMPAADRAGRSNGAAAPIFICEPASRE
jgi:hypothetical protein